MLQGKHLLWMGRVATIAGILISVGTGLLGKELPEHHGLHAGDLFLGQCPALRDNAPWHVRLVDHAERRVLGVSGGMCSSFFLYLAVKFDWFAQSLITMSKRPKRHGCKLLARLVGVA